MEGLRSPLDQVAECVERTLSAESARIRVSHEPGALPPPRKPRRRGGLLRPLVKPASALARTAFERATSEWMSFEFEGFIEPSRRRYVLASSRPWCEIYKDEQRWTGRPGQPLSRLKPVATGFPVDVWFLLDGLRGLDAATADGEEDVRGTPCTRLDVRVDLARASGAAPAGLRPPAVERFEDLLALPLTVSIDGTQIRRVRFEADSRTSGLELWDFGVSTGDLDWFRLPAPLAQEEDRSAGGGLRRVLHRTRRQGA